MFVKTDLIAPCVMACSAMLGGVMWSCVVLVLVFGGGAMMLSRNGVQMERRVQRVCHVCHFSPALSQVGVRVAAYVMA